MFSPLQIFQPSRAFKSSHPFHESYFEHACTINTESDVLDTDIQGNGWRVKMKRAFHSCFLLSYDDERCREFFVSSHALRLERARHYRLYRGRIHPLSYFIKVWEIFYFTVLILNRVMFHINTALFYSSNTSFTIIFGMICEYLALVDIIISFKAGYLDKHNRKVILDATMGYVHFASTRLFVYAASAIPLQTTLFVRYGFERCVPCKANMFTCVLKLISVFTVVRLYWASSFLGRTRRSFARFHVSRCFRVVILAVLTMSQLTDFIDTVNILIMLKIEKVTKHTYLEMILKAKKNLAKVSDFFFLAIEFCNLCKSVMVFGYGLYRNDYYLDKIFSLICHVIGVGFFTWGALETYSIVHRLKFANDEHWVRRERTKSWMRSFQLSDLIHDKVVSFYHTYLCLPSIVEKHNDLHKFLPKSLTDDIKFCTYYDFVRRIPFFSNWPIDVLEELVMLLKQDLYLEGDYVALPFTESGGLVILYAGFMAVYDARLNEVGHLIDGDYFGELSLVSDNEVQTSAVAALTACQVLTLDKIDFRKMMRNHEDLFYELRSLLLQSHEDQTKNKVPKDTLDKTKSNS
ncbi:cyclic nucleotide-binding domain-containing protein [Phthorimaea operculella]|nr:cyclic nucleotide-binding domain-containing protein [Phthorimaea operculella]